ncbi:MAG: hypothetical protein J0I21_00430 [Alphaproteobacteria bacterium]|nr:hypothetical protein [Alphaproteobacteria bacterium]
MTEDAQPEKRICDVLRRVSRQRVPLVLKPGDIWLIDNAVADDDETHAALLTCYMRGWVEPLEHAVPSGRLGADGSLPREGLSDGLKTLYRVTPQGWEVIHRTQEWSIFAIVVAVLSFLISTASLLVAIWPLHR